MEQAGALKGGQLPVVNKKSITTKMPDLDR
jgi:hypothetical protein